MPLVEVDSLSIEYDESGERPMVLDGRLDLESHTLFGSIISQQLDAAQYLLLNLENLSYVSSDGLRTFVQWWKVARQRGGDLVLVRPSQRVREVLDLAGLLNFFASFEDQEQATNYINALLGYADDGQSAVE